MSVVEFKIGDSVSLHVPKIDRSGTDCTRIPVKIVSVKNLNNHSKYQLLSDSSIIENWFSGEDLKTSSIEINCSEENQNKTITLRAASANFNMRKVAVSTTCNCKSSCSSKNANVLQQATLAVLIVIHLTLFV